MRFPRDDNRVPVVGGVSASDPEVPVPLTVDPGTGRLLVQSSGGGGGGDVQYDEGNSVFQATGTVALFKNYATNELISANVDANGNQSVNILSGDIDVDLRNVNGSTVDVGTGTADSGTQRVAVASDSSITVNAGTNLNTSALALESGGNLAAINAKMVSGTDIGDVTINNTSGAGAVNIQDGGNSITVDGTVAATQSGSWAVAGSKTNNNAAPTTDNLGVLPALVNASSPTFTEGNQTLLSINTTGNLRTTLNQLAGNTVSTGNGASGTGVLRVAQVNDGTGVLATVTNVATIGTSVTPGTAAANLGKAEDAAHASGDTGVMSLGVRNDGAATSFSSTDGDYTPLATDAQGRLYVIQKAPTATLSNVASSATSVTLLAANTGRLAAQIYNDSTQVLYVKFGTTASATSFTVPLASNTYYEVPGGYTGRIDGIWASAAGNARITELT